jgi:hypothetical protein
MKSDRRAWVRFARDNKTFGGPISENYAYTIQEFAGELLAQNGYRIHPHQEQVGLKPIAVVIGDSWSSNNAVVAQNLDGTQGFATWVFIPHRAGTTALAGMNDTSTRFARAEFTTAHEIAHGFRGQLAEDGFPEGGACFAPTYRSLGHLEDDADGCSGSAGSMDNELMCTSSGGMLRTNECKVWRCGERSTVTCGRYNGPGSGADGGFIGKLSCSSRPRGSNLRSWNLVESEDTADNDGDGIIDETSDCETELLDAGSAEATTQDFGLDIGGLGD